MRVPGALRKSVLVRAAAVAVAAAALGFTQGPDQAVFISGGFVVDGQIVKGVPYQAQAVTTVKQTLATGAQITTEMKALVARDIEGRTRREQTLGSIGPWTLAGRDSPTLIVIQDPVKQMNYVLDPKTHLARYSHQEPFDPDRYARQLTEQKNRANLNEPRTEKVESLGNKKIEGVLSQGKRTITTFPVGSVGNSAPLDIVVEYWYSPDLKVVILNRKNDPRVGEITYRLTNIVKKNPPASLFDVPPEYHLERDSERRIEERTRKEEPR